MVAASQARSSPTRRRIQSVYLLGPDFRTLGGFETQIMLLTAGLRARQIEVDIFIREPVSAGHPYRLRIEAAGGHLHAPAPWQASVMRLPRQSYPLGFGLLSIVLAPAMLALAIISVAGQHRPLRRAWQGVRGRWRGLLAVWENFDGLTWWMERTLAATARVRPPDIVDVQHSILPAGLAYARRRGWLAVYTEHGAPDEAFPGLWDGLAPVIDSAVLIIGRAQASLDGLRRVSGATAPGVVVPQAVLTQPDEAQVRAYPPPAGDPVVIGSFCRLSREKGMWDVLEAYRQLVADGVAADLVLAGDGPLRAALEAEVARRGYGQRVRFLGAYRNDDLGPILAQIDIVAHASLHDGRAMAVLEAMAWGRPIVATGVGGVPEIIEDGVSGLLVPPSDPAALAGALKQLIADPALRQRLGRAARASFLAGGFNAENMVQATVAAYELARDTAGALQQAG